MTLSWLVLMPATFMSNIFVDPATMPGWLAAIVDINPVALLVTAVRALMDGTATVGQVGLALLAPAVVLAIFAPVAMLLYRRER
jgi:ABC-2 type transport system permease protein